MEYTSISIYNKFGRLDHFDFFCLPKLDKMNLKVNYFSGNHCLSAHFRFVMLCFSKKAQFDQVKVYLF